MVIQPTGGLCNYLRVVFSYYLESKEKDEELTVIWRQTGSCPGFFLDYFEPVKGINFIKTNENNLEVYYTGGQYNANKLIDYTDLNPLPEIKSIIKEKIELLKNYIAVHVRRTDHTNLAKINNRYTEDNSFFNFIEYNIENKNLYVATDNLDTYNTFKNKYNQFVKFDYHPITEGLRQTTLKNAIVDLYMCVYADKFMGSGYSSFSGTINILRKYRRVVPNYLQ